MALKNLFLTQSVKRSFSVLAKQYVRGGEFIKFGSAVGGIHLQHTLSMPKPRVLPSILAVQNKSLNLNEHVKTLHTSDIKKSESTHSGNHAKLWTVERILTAGLLGVVPAAIMFPSTPMDVLLATSLVLHNHWGIEAIAVDYVRPIIFGKIISVIAHGLVYVLSITTFVGLMFLIFNDCGLANAIHLLWKI